MRSDQAATFATLELNARISQTKGTVKIVREIPLETNRILPKESVKGKAKARNANAIICILV